MRMSLELAVADGANLARCNKLEESSFQRLTKRRQTMGMKSLAVLIFLFSDIS
jgi:hypothetical protein